MVLGRLDSSGRLVAADPELEALQLEAGAALGQRLALPQIAAIAELARQLGTEVVRPAIAAAADHDVEVRVRAEPRGDEIALSLEDWTTRPAQGPRLAALIGAAEAGIAGAPELEWGTDEQLRVVALSPDLAKAIGTDLTEVVGEPLTRLLKLEEDADGDMALMRGVAARTSFSGQRCRSRGGDDMVLILDGDPVTSPDGRFAGFRGTARVAKQVGGPAGITDDGAGSLDDLLRSPLDRIIASAERIVERADGPLRSDYVGYGTDIASAARHLLSVIRGMSEAPAATGSQARIDISALAAEAVLLSEGLAEDRAVLVELERVSPLAAMGQERAVIQILVNLIGNAIRYSPRGGSVHIRFERTRGTASVCVSDQGPGIAAEDHQRIFERFERAHQDDSGTGLGLAICRRLARSMGGDVTVASRPGEGASFTLTLAAG